MSREDLDQDDNLNTERVVLPEEGDDPLSSLNEVSNKLLHKYVNKAKKSVKKIMNGPYSNHEDDKVFKRKMYISFAQHSRLQEASQTFRHPEEKKAYVECRSDGTFKSSNKHGKVKFWNKDGKHSAFKHAGLKLIEEENLNEREDLDVSFRAAVHRRDTNKHDVRHRSNQRMRHMVDNNRAQYVMRTGFKPASGNPNHFVDRQKHQLTDKWRNQRLLRLKLLRTNKNLKEDNQYLKNRQALHAAHAEAGKSIGRKERDPELKRLHMHRAKKHEHAAKVLEILRSRKKKK